MKAFIVVKDHHFHDSRVRKEAQMLSDMGFKTTVIASMDFGFEKKEKREGYDVLRIGARTEFEFSLKTSRYILKKGASLVWVCDHDAMLCGVFLKRKAPHIITVIDFHELWPGIPKYNGRRFAKRFAMLFERIFTHYYDIKITVSDNIASIMRKYMKLKEAPLSLYNCPLYKDYSYKKEEVRKDLGIPKERKIVVHQGLIIPGRNLELFIKTMKNLPDVFFYLIGEDRSNGGLMRLANEHGVSERVKIFPPVPFEEMMRFLSLGDVAFLGFEPSCPSFELSSPNKLFEDLMLEIPVIATKIPGYYNVLKNKDFAFFYDVNNDISLLNAVKNFFESKKDIYNDFKELKKVYCWENQRKKFEKKLSKFQLKEYNKNLDIKREENKTTDIDLKKPLVVRCAPFYSLDSFVERTPKIKKNLLVQKEAMNFISKEDFENIVFFENSGFFKFSSVSLNFIRKILKTESREVVLLTGGRYEDYFEDKWRFFLFFRLLGYKVYGYGPSQRLRVLRLWDFNDFLRNIMILFKFGEES